MILLWFCLGILLAFGIARYNESNKLFWTLALSFILGFAGMVAIQRTVTPKEEQSEQNLTQLCPTQAPVVTQSNLLYLLADDNNTATVQLDADVPVSQDYTAADSEEIVPLSMVDGSARDQPPDVEVVNTS